MPLPTPASPTIQLLTGTEVAANHTLREAILALDRMNMEPIMAAAAFDNFPWDRRIMGLLDPDTILFTASIPNSLCGYLELHPRRLGGGTVYISSLQITPTHRATRLFLQLLRAGAKWLRDDDSSTSITTEVQAVNIRMNAILLKLGFTFHEGKHSHTRHARLSRQTLLQSRILSRPFT